MSKWVAINFFPFFSFFDVITSQPIFSLSATSNHRKNVILTVFNIALSFFALWLIFSETSIKCTEPFAQPHAIILPDSCGFTHFIEWSEICRRETEKNENFLFFFFVFFISSPGTAVHCVNCNFSPLSSTCSHHFPMHSGTLSIIVGSNSSSAERGGNVLTMITHTHTYLHR